VLATVHRAENTDNAGRLSGILDAINAIGERVVLPMHPRTRRAVERVRWTPASTVLIIDPVGYLDMIRLESAAVAVLTDSGGVQKEAFWLGVPCVTLRDETEWPETLAGGRNVLAGADTERIISMTGAARQAGVVAASRGPDVPPSQRMARILTEFS
jgi:UDP-GlcNAc3NAcA epimerase